MALLILFLTQFEGKNKSSPGCWYSWAKSVRADGQDGLAGEGNKMMKIKIRRASSSKNRG